MLAYRQSFILKLVSFYGHKYLEFQKIKELADQDVAWACGLVGVAYCNGEHELIPSLPKGLKYLRKAADSGRPSACFEVGRMLMDGLGCEKDTAKAEHYFLQALKKGHDESALALTTLNQKQDDYASALYFYLLYIAYGGEIEQDIFEFLNQRTEPKTAEKMHFKAEEFKQTNPKPNEIEMLGYSGVFVEYDLRNGDIVGMSISHEEHFLPIAVEAAHEFIDTYRKQKGL